MAIYGINEEINSNITRKESDSLVPHYETDATETNLVATVSGQSWKVTFFHRITPNNMDITTYDPNLDITLYDYNRIDDFIIKLDSPVPTGTPDNMDGSGIIDTSFRPNVADVFLAKIPDGRTVIYAISAVKRINYNNNYLYRIEFKAHTIISDPNDPILNKLIKATTNHLVYNEKFRLTHDKPLYGKDEYKIREQYLSYIDALLKLWADRYILTENKYFISFKYKDMNEPKISYRVFDPYIERFVKHIIGINNLPNDLELMSLEDNNVTILDALLNNNVIFKDIKQYYVLKNLGQFTNNPYLFPIQYTGINKLISVTNIDDDTIDSKNAVVNDLFPKLDNKFYIFRQYIYLVLGGDSIEQYSDNLTLFEIMVLKMMDSSPLNHDDIMTIYKNIILLDEKEMFYFIPIFIYMLRYSLEVFTVEFIN